MTSVMWFRRDLRLSDHPALAAAAATGRVLPLVVLDPQQLDRAGERPRARFLASVHALNNQLDGGLVVRRGDPREVVPSIAAEIGADSVHASADFTPFGQLRDAQVAKRLEIPLVHTGSPYAVAPGRVLKADGTPFRVYTPYYRAWLAHGWRAPASVPEVDWITAKSEDIPDVSMGFTEPVGEVQALDAWGEFLDNYVAQYAQDRDRPDLPGTSRLSAALRFGEVHPRTLLADLNDETGPAKFRSELAWREFCADLLVQRPTATKASLDERFDRMRWDEGAQADARFAAWCAGRTGYPIVDAGMRQLLAEGWIHNRVRMVVASFLVKHLHVAWQRGADWFMQHLVDGDTASNSLGWQWVTGSGADAAPYVRIFNPILQGRKFDLNGEYVRKYVPELRGIPDAAIHEPWLLPTELTAEYPAPIIELAAERADALARFSEIRES